MVWSLVFTTTIITRVMVQLPINLVSLLRPGIRCFTMIISAWWNLASSKLRKSEAKFNRKSWKQRQLLSESEFVVRISPPPLSRDRKIKMKKSSSLVIYCVVNVETLILDERTRSQNLPLSCDHIRNSTDANSTENGIYYIQDSNNISFPVYCDMSSGGGGWTLVASIHENNIRSTGRCAVGDKWSSEHGHEQGSQVGAEAWFNYKTFGDVVSATSDDYKNQAYFDLQARDVMIWQVPNDTPLQQFKSASYLRYRTNNEFLSLYGGNMLNLYKGFYPIKSGVYTTITDNGPAIPVVFDKGSAAEVRKHFGAAWQPLIDAGYIQVINMQLS